MARSLREAGLEVEWTRVHTEQQFVSALERSPDVVLADYNAAGFGALRALKVLRERQPDVPFLIVAGAIDEDKAAEAIRLGADDYVWKDRLARLPTAVRNMVTAARERGARRKVQSELEALGERLKSIVTALPDVVWSVALPSLQPLYISPAAANVFGRSPHQFYEDATLWLALVHPKDRRRMAAAWREPRPGEYHSEYRIVKSSGEVRWIQGRGYLVSDPAGKAVRADGISRDVTEIVKLHQALREREAGLRHAQVMAKLAHVVTRADGTFESWSGTLPQLAGVAPHALPRSTRRWLELLHPDDRQRFRAASIAGAKSRARQEVEYRLRRPDGVVYIRQTMDPLDGRRWFSTLQDITQSKLADERIKRLNRVHAVLSGINAAIVRIHDEAELFAEACRVAVDAGRFAMAWIGLVDVQASIVRP